MTSSTALRRRFGKPFVRLSGSLALLAGTAAAAADPITYEGMIGDRAVVVELTADPSSTRGEVAGRFFYRSEGVDIPLHFVRRDGSVIEFVEEEACDRERCPEGTDAPRGAAWTLEWHLASAALKGSAGGKDRPVVLHYVASRKAEAGEAATPQGLFQSSEQLVHSDIVIDARSHPYDHARLNEELATRKTVEWGDARFAYVADERAPLAYPRLVSLPGGGSTDAANEILNQRHWRNNLGAFTCMALRHAAFQEEGDGWGAGFGSTGGFDETWVEVGQLNDRVMGWTESGSIMCGGMSPSNFSSAHVMDVERGELVETRELFAGWTEDGPGEALVEFVQSRRPKAEGYTLEHEEECGTDDLMQHYLGVSLGRDDSGATLVTFGLKDLPTVINACADDLLTLPAAELADLLTPQGAALLR